MPEVEQSAPQAPRSNRSLLRWILALAFALLVVGLLVFYFRPTMVPNLTMKTGEEASELLAAAELRVGTVSHVATTAVGEGLVVAQSPAGGTRVRRRSAVAVTRAVAAVPVAIPNVTGLDLDAATHELEDAQFAVRTVDILETDDKVGTVLAQVPPAGTQWMTGQPVALGVAAGPDDGTGTAVPDIYGDSFNTAIDTLAEAGLLGYGFAVDPTQVQTSEVDQQLPAAGMMVRQGTTVLFLLGER